MGQLLFMGVYPDGWACPKCHGYFAAGPDGMPRDKPLGIII
jgi:hypothetical protein